MVLKKKKIKLLLCSGFLGAVFQGFVNAAPNVVFDSIKPFMLKEAYEKIRHEIDTNIAKITGNMTLPNSISPLDMGLAELRKLTRAKGFDPFKMPSYNHTVGVFALEMSNTWVAGLASFYRVGDIVLSIDNNTVTAGIQIGTQKLVGASQWQVSVGNGMITRVGHVQFTVQHIKATVEVSQAMDTRKQPKINDLQLELGNIQVRILIISPFKSNQPNHLQVRCDGAGTLDYVTEFLVNVLPNLLRYQIMDAIEKPLKMRIQEHMNKFNVEELIKQKVPEFQEKGMDMSLDFIFKI